MSCTGNEAMRRKHKIKDACPPQIGWISGEFFLELYCSAISSVVKWGQFQFASKVNNRKLLSFPICSCTARVLQCISLPSVEAHPSGLFFQAHSLHYLCHFSFSFFPGTFFPLIFAIVPGTFHLSLRAHFSAANFPARQVLLGRPNRWKEDLTPVSSDNWL